MAEASCFAYEVRKQFSLFVVFCVIRNGYVTYFSFKQKYWRMIKEIQTSLFYALFLNAR